MADDKVTVAVDEVAKHVIHRLLTYAVESGDVAEMWEDYPLIGDYDWQTVEGRVLQLAKDIKPDAAVFDAAYEFLKGRTSSE